MNDAIWLTIAIPTFNRTTYLKRAIISALADTDRGIEVIVYDNASTEDVAQAIGPVTDPRLTFFRHATNVGMRNNWNAALAKARGTWFLLLSDDDHLLQGAIERFRKSVQSAGTNVNVIISPSIVCDEVTRTSYLSKPSIRDEEWDLGRFAEDYAGLNGEIFPCSTLLRTQQLRAQGGYAESWTLAMDAAAMFDMAKHGAVRGISEPTATYSCHANNNSNRATMSISEEDKLGLYLQRLLGSDGWDNTALAVFREKWSRRVSGGIRAQCLRFRLLNGPSRYMAFLFSLRRSLLRLKIISVVVLIAIIFIPRFILTWIQGLRQSTRHEVEGINLQ